MRKKYWVACTKFRRGGFHIRPFPYQDVGSDTEILFQVFGICVLYVSHFMYSRMDMMPKWARVILKMGAHDSGRADMESPPTGVKNFPLLHPIMLANHCLDGRVADLPWKGVLDRP
jgi:hypothetical protein